MTPVALVSEEQYLRSSYDPDVDFVDGMLEERNVGEHDHSDLQAEIVHWVRQHGKELGLNAFSELRTRIGPGRFRVPDIVIVERRRLKTTILEQPPIVAIEILSPEDRISRMQERIDDYLGMGTPLVWLIDPATRRAWIYRPGSIEECKDGNLRAGPPDFVLPLREIFAAIDSIGE